MPKSKLTRENAPAMLRELQATRESLSKADSQLPKIVFQIALIQKYLKG